MVDFLKYLTPEQRDKVLRDREYISEQKASYSVKNHYELVVTVLHTYHNSGCTSRTAKWQAADPVYDASLVFFLIPEMIERLSCFSISMNDPSPQNEAMTLYKEIIAHRIGELAELKCPMKGCRGYVALP